MELLTKYIIALIFTSLSTYTDIKYGKIKNIFSLSLILLSLVLSLVFLDLNFTDNILGLMVPLILGFPFYALKMFGAGDIKLFCGLGALFGVEWILWCMAYSIFSGGVVALFIIIISNNAIDRFKYLFNYLKYTFLTLKFTPYQNFDKNTGTFPFAIAILLGVIVSAFVDFKMIM
jgi:prepilin peptidase CpaA